MHEGWQRPWNNDPEARARAQETKDRAAIAASTLGRWPANVVLDEEAAAVLDEQSGELTSGAMKRPYANTGHSLGAPSGATRAVHESNAGGASRFFYTAKASRSERNAGIEQIEKRVSVQSNGAKAAIERGDTEYLTGDTFGFNKVSQVRNNHPTVKPVDLMRWLVRLVTPEGGTVLDPFMGSGTTGCAAVVEGRHFCGIEKEQEYIELAKARILATPLPLFGAPE
jgi:tRNA G10  N-methylase Trm11